MDKKKLIGTIIGVLLFATLIAGATFAYFQSSVTGSNNVNALSYKFDVTLNVALVNPSTAPSKGYGLIPIDEANIGTAITNNCIDSNGYAACRIYELTFTNNSGQAVTLNGTLTPSSNNFANLKYSVTTVGGAKNTLTAGNPLPNAPVTTGFQNLTIPVNTSKMYVMLYVNNLNANQPNDQGKTFSGSLTLIDASGGNQLYAIFDTANYVYTVNTNASVNIGDAIPGEITQYLTPAEAMAAFNNRPFYLKHKIAESWCVVGSGDFSSCDDEPTYKNEESCTLDLQDMATSVGATDNGDGTFTYEGVTVRCSTTGTSIVEESYVEFVVTDEMVQQAEEQFTTHCESLEQEEVILSDDKCNSPYYGMTAGTYILKGGTGEAVYNENKQTLLKAFGSSNCQEILPSSHSINTKINCNIWNMLTSASANDNGYMGIGISENGTDISCNIQFDGSSECMVTDDNGGSAN